MITNEIGPLLTIEEVTTNVHHHKPSLRPTYFVPRLPRLPAAPRPPRAPLAPRAPDLRRIHNAITFFLYLIEKDNEVTV